MKKEKPLISQGFRSAPGGTRTHTLSPASDFESDVSASSATSAYQLLEYTIIEPNRMQEKFFRRKRASQKAFLPGLSGIHPD